MSATANAAEPSVFGAGDLNHPNPYGLTNEEKLILENKKVIQSVLQKNNMQSAKVETVTERLDGMQGIIEGLGERANEQALSLQKINEKLALENEQNVKLDNLTKQVSANTENISQLKTLLEELSHAIDTISSNYVTKEQFGELIKQLKLGSSPSASEVTIDKLDNIGLENEAKRLFEQKKYAEAQAYYQKMIRNKYKLPESYYMIGETLFERQSYKEAILYFKDSASRNEKAGYMPTLLLHSAMAMERTGDIAMAKTFYQATISKYNGSGAAKEAAAYLAKLK
ncbi:MAG: hypothetical protein PHW64_08455 [Sulfuricurvum sp.]|nr:hypothetical protein [Sulfuricurvum sp.]